jgi:hypothetical protein
MLIHYFTFGLNTTKKVSDGMKLPAVSQKNDVVERRTAHLAIRLLFPHRSKSGAPPVCVVMCWYLSDNGKDWKAPLALLLPPCSAAFHPGRGPRARLRGCASHCPATASVRQKVGLGRVRTLRFRGERLVVSTSQIYRASRSRSLQPSHTRTRNHSCLASQAEAIADVIAPPTFLLQLEAAAAIAKGPAAVDELLSKLRHAADPVGVGAAAGAAAGSKRPREFTESDDPAELIEATSADIPSVVAFLTTHRTAFAGGVPAGLVVGVPSAIVSLREKVVAHSDGMRALSNAMQLAQKKSRGGDDPREDIIRRLVIAYLKREKPKAVRVPRLPPTTGAAGAASTAPAPAPGVPPSPAPLPMPHHASSASAVPSPAGSAASPAVHGPAATAADEVDDFSVLSSVFGVGRAAFEAIMRGRL